jgi:hypothetical protein
MLHNAGAVPNNTYDRPTEASMIISLIRPSCKARVPTSSAAHFPPARPCYLSCKLLSSGKRHDSLLLTSNLSSILLLHFLSKALKDRDHHPCPDEREADKYVELGSHEQGWHDGDAQNARVWVILAASTTQSYPQKIL